MKNKSNDNLLPIEQICREFDSVLSPDFDAVERAVAVGLFQAVAHAALFEVDFTDTRTNTAALNCIVAARFLSETRLVGVTSAILAIDFGRLSYEPPAGAAMRAQLIGALYLARVIMSAADQLL